MFLTTAPTLDENYKKIVNVLSTLEKCGGLHIAQGNCISSSEMVRLALLSEGIKSHLVECSLQIRINENGHDILQYIGVSGLVSNPAQVDTHMVTITDTDTPYLIDASISAQLPRPYGIVLEKIDMNSDNLLLINEKTTNRSFSLIYTEKKNKKATHAYQMSIIDRIATDAKIFKEIEYLKLLNYIGIAASVFSIINAGLNLLMLYK